MEVDYENPENSKIFLDTKFGMRSAELNGPVLPHIITRVGSAIDMSVKRPQIKVCCFPNTDNFDLLNRIDLVVRAAYEFALTDLGTVFPGLLTFFPQPVEVVTVSRGQKSTSIGYMVMAVTKNFEVMPLHEFIPSNCTPKQEDVLRSIQNARRITEGDVTFMVKGKETASPAYMFSTMKPRIHDKTGRLYIDMNLLHSRFPTINGEQVNKYLNTVTNPYHPAMSRIDQWGIKIPYLIHRSSSASGYVCVQDSDWVTNDPSFKPVTTDRENNNFIGTVNFSVDRVMEGAGKVKTWWRAHLYKQPEPSKLTRGIQHNEEMIDAADCSPEDFLPRTSASHQAPETPYREPQGVAHEGYSDDDESASLDEAPKQSQRGSPYSSSRTVGASASRFRTE